MTERRSYVDEKETEIEEICWRWERVNEDERDQCPPSYIKRSIVRNSNMTSLKWHTR